MAKKEKEKKPLNVAQRVELLLIHGVENPQKWATAHGYEDPSDEEKEIWQSNEDCVVLFREWKRLREHHLAETNFLFEVIKEMREQILALDEQLDVAGPKKTT